MLHAPALTPIANGNFTPLSINASNTPQVKTPRRPPPSSTNAVFSLFILIICLYMLYKVMLLVLITMNFISLSKADCHILLAGLLFLYLEIRD